MPSQITIDVNPSFEAIGKAFNSIDISAFLNEEVPKIAFLVENYSKQVTPVDTGRLRGSISTDIGNLRARVATATDYAVYVHEGTRKMKSRPFMQEGVEFTKRRVETKDVAERLDRKIRDKLSHLR